jgi:hypothetical protein
MKVTSRVTVILKIQIFFPGSLFPALPEVVWHVRVFCPEMHYRKCIATWCQGFWSPLSPELKSEEKL